MFVAVRVDANRRDEEHIFIHVNAVDLDRQQIEVLKPGIVTLPCEGARAVYALRIFKPPRRPHATWSSPRRVARGEIELI